MTREERYTARIALKDYDTVLEFLLAINKQYEMMVKNGVLPAVIGWPYPSSSGDNPSTFGNPTLVVTMTGTAKKVVG